MTAGSHHMFVFYPSGAKDGSIYDCSGLQLQPFTFVAQGPHVFQTCPGRRSTARRSTTRTSGRTRRCGRRPAGRCKSPPTPARRTRARAPTRTPLSFGESVNNIMCIGQAIFYPAADIANPFLGCTAQ